MQSLVIENGLIVTMDKQHRIFKQGTIAIEDGKIIGVEKSKEAKGKYRAEKTIDAKGKIVMPGFICSHHHLYSTFARGMAIPGKPAENFSEILEKLWWKLDNALTQEDVYYSSLVPLMECVRNGTTAIIDTMRASLVRKGV